MPAVGRKPPWFHSSLLAMQLSLYTHLISWGFYPRLWGITEVPLMEHILPSSRMYTRLLNLLFSVEISNACLVDPINKAWSMRRALEGPSLERIHLIGWPFIALTWTEAASRRCSRLFCKREIVVCRQLTTYQCASMLHWYQTAKGFAKKKIKTHHVQKWLFATAVARIIFKLNATAQAEYIDLIFQLRLFGYLRA